MHGRVSDRPPSCPPQRGPRPEDVRNGFGGEPREVVLLLHFTFFVMSLPNVMDDRHRTDTRRWGRRAETWAERAGIIDRLSTLRRDSVWVAILCCKHKRPRRYVLAHACHGTATAARDPPPIHRCGGRTSNYFITCFFYLCSKSATQPLRPIFAPSTRRSPLYTGVHYGGRLRSIHRGDGNDGARGPAA